MRRIITLTLLLLGTTTNAFCDLSAPVIINSSGKLNYQKITIPTMRYKNVFSVNSRLELVGQVRNSSCLEVFGIDAKVLRSTCLESRTVASVRIGESGDVSGVYYQKSDSGDESPRIFRLDSQGALEILSIPKSLENEARYAEITGINDSGTIVGFISNSFYAPSLEYADTKSASFLAEPHQPLVMISATSSLGTQVNGIVDNIIFGMIRRGTEDQLGTEVVGWVYDLFAASDIWIGEAGSVVSQRARSGEYLNSDTVFSTGNQPLNVRFQGYSGAYAKRKINLLSKGSAISADGYRVWRSADGPASDAFDGGSYHRIEKDGKLSESLSCAIQARSGESSHFIGLAQKGVALFFESWAKPVVFVPSESDSLSNYCLFMRFEVPASARKNLRVIRNINLKERHQLRNKQRVPMTIRVFDGTGIPMKGVQLSLDIENDGKPAIKHWTTNAQGRARLLIPFYDKPRRYYDSFLAQIKIKRPRYYTLTSTIYPYYYHGPWV